ncbi:MAG: hypothetical protein D6794_04045 [Deltaproteobacteria bacterium]|nr:MAG: hypothetical protein D6794_04045 [Deltaproteobacteria bacterium]
MNRVLLMGVFALVLALLPLWRILRDREDGRLVRLNRAWGRRTGLALFFVLQVGLPMLFGILFLSQGVVAFARDGIAWDLSAGLPLLRNYLNEQVVVLVPPLEPLFPPDLLVP